MGEWNITPETAQLLRNGALMAPPNTVTFSIEFNNITVENLRIVDAKGFTAAELYTYLKNEWDIDTHELRNLLAKIKATP